MHWKVNIIDHALMKGGTIFNWVTDDVDYLSLTLQWIPEAEAEGDLVIAPYTSCYATFDYYRTWWQGYTDALSSTLMTSLNKTTDAELNGIFPLSSLHKLINIAWEP